MRWSSLFVAIGAIAAAEAFSFPGKDIFKSLPRRDGDADLESRALTCPSIWTTVVKDLHSSFLSNGQCNDLARQAVRAAFHDCGTYTPDLGTSAGCDGSLVLADEYENSENKGLQQIGDHYKDLLTKYKVGAADLIQMGACTSTHFSLASTHKMLTRRNSHRR